MAQADNISIDNGKIHGGESNNINNSSSNNELFQNSRLKSLRFINTLSYLLTTVTILTTIHTNFYGNDDEYDNYTEWMANQTLLSVAPYTRYIWYVLCVLQALFVGAAFMEGLQMNMLLGYTALAKSQEEEQLEANNNLTSPVVHYPALCASSLLMMYSVKLNIMTCALLGSCLTTYFLINIIKFHLWNTTTTVATDTTTTTSKKEWFQQYICIQLPFELYAGYNLGLNIMFLNIVLRKLIPSAITFDVFLAAVSLVTLLIVGCYVTWKEKRLYYGIGGGLVWYLVSAKHQLSYEWCIIVTLLRFIRLYLYESLNHYAVVISFIFKYAVCSLYTYNNIKLGVYFQLVDLSTPIMTTYSSGVIEAIMYMAVIFANIILSTVVLRAAKNHIHMRIVCGSGRMDDVVSDDDDEGESEDELEASYTHV